MADATADEKILSMDDVERQVDDIEYAKVPTGKPGEFIRIGSLTAGDMIEWSEANEGEAKRTAGLRLIVKSMVDQNGRRIGHDSHIKSWRAKSHKMTENIVKEILKLNGIQVKGEGDAAKKD